MLDYSGEYRGTSVIVFTAIFIPIQIFAVVLRYLARRLIKTRCVLEDVAIYISLVVQMAFAGIAFATVLDAGVGHHVGFLVKTNPEKLTRWNTYIMASSVLYWASSNFPKFAILLLYRRVFPSKGNQIVVHSLMAILALQTVATSTANLIGWIPVHANEPITSHHGVDNRMLSIYGSLPNIITDIVMLLLPMRVVWNLQLVTRLKVGLTITFLIGSLGLITSTIRFITFFQNDEYSDGTWASVELTIWTQMEIGMYLVSACLMSCRPLLEVICRRKWLPGCPRPGRRDAIKSTKWGTADIPMKFGVNITNKQGSRRENDEDDETLIGGVQDPVTSPDGNERQTKWIDTV